MERPSVVLHSSFGQCVPVFYLFIFLPSFVAPSLAMPLFVAHVSYELVVAFFYFLFEVGVCAAEEHVSLCNIAFSHLE